MHEPFGLRSVVEVIGANGTVELGETYGDAPVLDLLTRVKDSMVGLSAFDLAEFGANLAFRPSLLGGLRTTQVLARTCQVYEVSLSIHSKFVS